MPPGRGGVLTVRNGTHTLLKDLQSKGTLPTAGLESIEPSEWSSPLNLEWEIRLHNIVAHSGLPNYLGCRIPISTNLKVPNWRTLLADYPDTQLVEFLEFGWPVGHDRVSWPVSDFTNHKGAKEHPTHMDKYLLKEVNVGATLGPFKYNPLDSPLCISPLNSVPKSDTERRPISDLSYPEGQSVNAGIPRDTYLGIVAALSFPTVDTIADLVVKHGPGCHIWKRDLARCYRQFPVDPRDICLLGSTWGGLIFIDRVAVMGLRTGALICQRTTSGVTHILKKHGYDNVNYQDDFIGVQSPPQAAEAFSFSKQLLAILGLEEKEPKAVSPDVLVEALGVLFNTLNMTMSVTPSRLEEISRLLDSWLNKQKASKKQLESLIGKLMFVAKCVPPGRVFVGRLLDCLRSISGRNPTFNVDKEILKDVTWWRYFMSSYNGVSLMLQPGWKKPDSVIATDACLSGGGGINLHLKQYFHFQFPPKFLCKPYHINTLELIVLVVALKLWGTSLTGHRVLMRCDNESTVSMINSGRGRDTIMLSWLRELVHISALDRFVLKCTHIAGQDNRLPDLLSRWHLGPKYSQEFYDQIANADWTEVQVPLSLLECRDTWCVPL